MPHQWTDPKDDKILADTVARLEAKNLTMPKGAFWAWVADETGLGISGMAARKRYERINGGTPPIRTPGITRHRWTVEEEARLLSSVIEHLKETPEKLNTSPFWSPIPGMIGLDVSAQAAKRHYFSLKSNPRVRVCEPLNKLLSEIDHHVMKADQERNMNHGNNGTMDSILESNIRIEGLLAELISLWKDN